MWDWFFETVEMIYHEKLYPEDKSKDEFEVINEESRIRADAVGGSEEDLSSFRVSKEPLRSVKYTEDGLVVDGFPSGKVDLNIEAWQNSKKTSKDFMTLFKNLMNFVPEVHKQQVKEDDESHCEESDYHDYDSETMMF